ncbi:MAG: zf-HC2 domain-containing protein [Candidatus Rokubacteria bacterium]|nr:zf-HC2 domain-containing protein [Candidatus Rokubacteria bacterium]
MLKLMCKEFIMDFLSDYLDGTLTPDVITALERHLQDCEPCVAYLNTYKKTRELTGRAGRAEMPTEMKVRLREFLLKQLTKGK